jgi:hypothetical protein
MVVDEPSLFALMRRNEYLTDGISTQGCAAGARSASNAIAERGDLTCVQHAAATQALSSAQCHPSTAAVACCCLLLPAVACCCLLLPAVACCCCHRHVVLRSFQTSRSPSADCIDPLVWQDECATDVKYTSYRRYAANTSRLSCMAQSGPTSTGSMPVFQWSTSSLQALVPHEGQPDVWNFPEVEMVFDL